MGCAKVPSLRHAGEVRGERMVSLTSSSYSWRSLFDGLALLRLLALLPVLSGGALPSSAASRLGPSIRAVRPDLTVSCRESTA
jgi:hypothetical protein